MKFLPHRYNNQKGQTMVEILIAMTVVTVVMVAVVSRAVDAVRSAQFARNQSLATRYAQEGVEWMRSQRDSLGWGVLDTLLPVDLLREYCIPDVSVAITDLTDGVCASTDVIGGTIFRRQISLSMRSIVDEGSYIEVEVLVTWTDSIGDHNSMLNTRLSDWVD